MIKTPKQGRSSATRGLLAAGASALALGAASALAAQPVDEIAEGTAASTSSDNILVTGSRIRRPVDTVRPVVDIDAAEFQTRGYVNVLEGLEQLPFVSIGVNNQGNNTQFGDNNAFVNLLGFGTQRTLTLIDGRRSVSANQGTVFVPDNASGAQVDLTIINPMLVKRTEVQTVGSGPIYGADAVAGVVNVILDRDLRGLKGMVQGGLTQEGDGGQYQGSLAWGTELFGGRGHFVVAGEYLKSDAIYHDPAKRPWTNRFTTFNNPLGTANGDGLPNTLFQDGVTLSQLPVSGLAALRQTNSGNTAVTYFPGVCAAAQTSNVAGCNAFAAANGGLTPRAFALANPTLNGINPLAFIGTFGLTSGFATIPNPNAAEVAQGLSRLAVPVTFDANGNPVPYNIGDVIPPNLSSMAAARGGDGFNDLFTNTIRAEQERYTFNSLWKYEFSSNLRYEGDVMFAQIDNDQRADNFGTQSPAGSITAGNASVPIYVNQNPFVTPATLAYFNSIQAANIGVPARQFPQIGGQDVMFISRSLFDITGGLDNREGNRARTYRTAHALYGEFEAFERNFNWDIAGSWSRSTSFNRGPNDIGDVEFALATDVVLNGAGQAVCRQQTLGAPEAINVRNPFLTNINIATGLVPTAQQVADCRPLNIFGNGRASSEAIDYVTVVNQSRNENTQWYGSAAIGGELFQLPGGMLQFNSQFEWRRESLEFTPNDVFELGLGRSTIGQPGRGKLRFFEGGQEFLAPIFGGENAPKFFNLLELSGAVRVVNRSGEGTPNGINNPVVQTASVTDVTFTAGGRWAPTDWLTFRGNRTRAVRSPSVVEALGAPQTGFSNLAGLFPCNGANRNFGPAGGIRITNCDAFEASLGLAPGTFASLFPPGGTVPAGVAGNPNILNEIANNYTAGVVFKPAFIPNLTISSDYVNLRLDNQIGLTFQGLQCFDLPTFPNSIVGGNNVCDAIILAVPTPTGVRIPANNIITGSPLIPQAIPGSLAPVQADYTIAAGLFTNANTGSIRLSALYNQVRYNFDVADLTGLVGLGSGLDLGTVYLNGQVYYIRKFQTSQNNFLTINNNAGEPGNEKFQTRLDVSHAIGRFSHTFQWFRDSSSQVNIDLNPAFNADQNATFFRPAYNTFNYNAGFRVSDNITARVIVNNLTNSLLLPEFGLPGDSIGRAFLGRIDFQF